MTQFNQGKPWTPVAGSPIDGGHCVTVIGYTSAYLLVVTWGKIQKMDYAFWNTYVAARAMQGEAWATVSQDWVNKAYGSMTRRVWISRRWCSVGRAYRSA